MKVDELIQLMRTCTMAQVREALQRCKDKSPMTFSMIAKVYKDAAKLPK